MTQEATATELVKIHAGQVIIREGGAQYIDTADNFALDAGEPFPALPPGAIGRSYIPGEKHRTTNGTKATQIAGPWVEGDALLLRVAELIAAKVAREDVPDVPPDALGVLREAAIEGLLARQAITPFASQAELDYAAALP
jgi:hypothetical protein